MKNILLYPLTYEVLSLIRSENFTSNYDKVMVSTYKGSGLNGVDCCFLDSGEETGIVVDEDFEILVEASDEVVLYENTKDIEYVSDLAQKRKYAESKGKKVFLISNEANDISSKEKEFFDSLQKIQIEIASQSCIKVEAEDFIEIEGLVDITVPIVGIVGNADNVGKFELQLQMKDELSERGYKVAVISSNRLCEFVGAYSFPKFMIEKQYSDKMKVLLFNRFLRYIELADDPDLIIVSVPGGIMPSTRRIVGDFGTLAYKTFKAVAPDYMILSMNFETYTNEYFEELEKFVKYNYGCELNAIKIKNSKTDWEDAEVTNKGSLLSYTINRSIIDNLIDQFDENLGLVFVTSAKESVSELIDNVEEELEANEAVLVF